MTAFHWCSGRPAGRRWRIDGLLVAASSTVSSIVIKRIGWVEVQHRSTADTRNEEIEQKIKDEEEEEEGKPIMEHTEVSHVNGSNASTMKE